MVLGYNNMNMYMYGNNGFGNLLQQGLNMLGGGYGMGSTSYFTNCYGEVNYDKMAGFQVANALLGTTFQMIASNKANKASEPEVNYTKELNAVAKEIKSKNDEWATKSDELDTLKKDKSENDGKLTALDQSLSSAKTSRDEAKRLYDVANAKTPKPDNIETLKTNYENERDNVDDLTAEKKELKDKIKQQKADIEAKTKEIDDIKQKIAELEDKQANLQKTANEKTIEGHKSSPLLRARKECINRWQQEPSDNTKSASKAELEKAFHVFKKGGDSIADKKEAAIAFTNMYKSLGDEKMISSFKSLNTAVQAWLDDYNKQHRQDVE